MGKSWHLVMFLTKARTTFLVCKSPGSTGMWCRWLQHIVGEVSGTRSCKSRTREDAVPFKDNHNFQLLRKITRTKWWQAPVPYSGVSIAGGSEIHRRSAATLWDGPKVSPFWQAYYRPSWYGCIWWSTQKPSAPSWEVWRRYMGRPPKVMATKAVKMKSRCAVTVPENCENRAGKAAPATREFQRWFQPQNNWEARRLEAATQLRPLQSNSPNWKNSASLPTVALILKVMKEW